MKSAEMIHTGRSQESTNIVPALPITGNDRLASFSDDRRNIGAEDGPVMSGAARMNSQRTTPMTMRDLVTASGSWDAAFSEISVDARELRFDSEGIQYGHEQIRTDQASRDRLFSKIDAPVPYLRKHNPDFQAIVLAEHASRGDFGRKPTLVLREGRLVTMTRGELLSLSNGDVFKAVEEALGRESRDLVVSRLEMEPERIDVELISSTREIAVRPGDIVRSGLHIVHERFGDQATLVEAFIYRLVCSNGMTRRECGGDGRARTRKLPIDFPKNRELQMAQIRRLTQAHWDGLQRKLEALRETGRQSANVEQLLTRWLQRGGMSARVIMPRLRAAWREEGEESTQYGAINALTRVATHDRSLSVRQRRALSSLAGLLAFSEVHICERCFSVLTRAA